MKMSFKFPSFRRYENYKLLLENNFLLSALCGSLQMLAFFITDK